MCNPRLTQAVDHVEAVCCLTPAVRLLSPRSLSWIPVALRLCPRRLPTNTPKRPSSRNRLPPGTVRELGHVTQRPRCLQGQRSLPDCPRRSWRLVRGILPALDVELIGSLRRFLLKYISRDEIDLLKSGNGGLAELREAIAEYDEKSPLFGLIHFRRKRALLKYVPGGTSRLLQGETLAPWLGYRELCF